MSEYNGWTNYETWAVALWMGNEEGSYNYARSQAREALADAKANPVEYLTTQEKATHSLADMLKDEHEDNNPLDDHDASVYSDLLRAALSDVNWHEIAKNLIDEVGEDGTDTDTAGGSSDD